MNPLVYLAMYGWIPVVLVLFALLPPRRAVIAATLIATLFLPMAGFNLPGLPDYTKTTATSIGLLLGIAIYDMRTLSAFRFHWFDVPMVSFCLVPVLASLTNGLGIYDAVSSVIYQTLMWGVPYLIGRMYFTTPQGLKELAVGLFIGGLIYMPLCLYEIRMSPQLHRMVYGFHQHQFAQTRRFGGFRPMVFMQHGLMLGLWMTASTITGFWLWRTRALHKILGVPILVWVIALAVTTVLCKSAGALAMGMFVLAVLWLCGRFKTAWPLLVFVIAFPTYLTLRSVNVLDGHEIVEIAQSIPYVAQRTASLESRVMNEAMLIDKTQERMLFGWASSFMVFTPNGKQVTTPDSMWILMLARLGLAGLVCWVVVSVLPIFAVWRQVPPRYFVQPSAGPIVIVAAITALFALDCILNAMLVPYYLLGMGGLCGLMALSPMGQSSRRRQRRVGPSASIGAGAKITPQH